MDRDIPLSEDTDFRGFAPEDEMGFAIPVTPAHSLRLVNDSMRTDLLPNVHGCVRKMRNQKKQRFPIHHLADKNSYPPVLSSRCRLKSPSSACQSVRGRQPLWLARDWKTDGAYLWDVSVRMRSPAANAIA
ncbi:hypothetical protein SAMN05192568_1003179 [Methylobacterium pseudosasicola]|uniref:Uncharacterized protein n=1 Tax=Methylobacterium pseudosasicola TaxID=582667 RepID=A0A1I4GR55_9HYPH|nr:hypothetical protein SAMN05192568_1003179 [Methylobacterium pseudosasicola]